MHLQTETIQRLLTLLEGKQSLEFMHPPVTCVTEVNKSNSVESYLKHGEFVG